MKMKVLLILLKFTQSLETFIITFKSKHLFALLRIFLELKSNSTEIVGKVQICSLRILKFKMYINSFFIFLHDKVFCYLVEFVLQLSLETIFDPLSFCWLHNVQHPALVMNPGCIGTSHQ